MKQQRQWVRGMMVAALLALAVCLTAPAAQAQTNTTSSNTTSTTSYSGCSAYPGVTNRIVLCVRTSLDAAAQTYFTQFYPIVADIIGGTITLSVAIFGVMLAIGAVERLGRDTFLLLIKLALVGFFTMNSQLIYSYIMTGMDSATQMVISAAPTTGQADDTKQFNGLTCMQAMAQASSSNNVPLGPWAAMDCLIDTVIGIKMPVNTSAGIATQPVGNWYNQQLSGQGLQRGMIYFFFSGISTSIAGLLLGILGFIFIWGLILVIIKALLTYLMGYMGIALLVIIGPLMIPLCLFRETKQYFDKWVQLLITFAMQPVLMMLFVILTIAAVDLSLYSGDYSVMYRLAGDQSRNSGFQIGNYLQQAITTKPANLAMAKTNQDLMNTVATVGNAIVNLGTSQCDQGNNTTDTTCKQEMPIRIWHNSIDWDKLASLRSPAVVPDSGATPGRQLLNEVMSATLLCGIVIFTMSKLMSVIPAMLSDLIGNLGMTPNLKSLATKGWNQGAQSASQQFGGGIQQTLGRVTDQIGKGFSDMITKRPGSGGSS